MRVAIVSFVAAMGVLALVLALWAVPASFAADDGSKPVVQTGLIVCGIACFVWAVAVWFRSRPTTD
jgi:hypothetical protein